MWESHHFAKKNTKKKNSVISHGLFIFPRSIYSLLLLAINSISRKSFLPPVHYICNLFIQFQWVPSSQEWYMVTMRNNYKLKITANLCQYRLFTIIFSTVFYSTTCVTVGSIMYLNESESNCEYLNESESNCEQILLKRNQCLSADPFEVFFVNPNSWAA